MKSNKKASKYYIGIIAICLLSFTTYIKTTGIQVTGIVLDQTSGAPIADAIVSQQATTSRTLTGQDGKFQLSGLSGEQLVIVGAKKGYYNNSVVVSAEATDVEILLDAVSQGDNPEYEIIDPTTCAACHVYQYEQWLNSPMASTGVNSWVYDIYSGDGTPGGMGGFVYLRDSEFAHSNPASECASCHQPEQWIINPYTALDSIGQISLGASHGISCEVCHKIAHIDVTKTNYPGIYPNVVTWTKPESDSMQVEYGLLGDSDVDFAPYVMRPSYQPQLVAQICAACHQDKNDPDEDGNFEEENGVISEPTYEEWLASPYSDTSSKYYATCVDCHMPSYGATVVCQEFDLEYDPPERDPETIRSHRIVGTTPYFLENAVSMVMDCEISGNTIEVKIDITNDKTGHHVPDGVSIRNMVLLVEAWRTDDQSPLTSAGSQVIHELGGVGDPAQGYYAGLPGKLFAKNVHDASGNGPVFFTEATGVKWDNRIPALATDSSFYTFDIPSGAHAFEVRARLIYRRAFRYLVDAKGWTKDGHGKPLEDVLPPHFGHLMEEANWTSGTVAVSDGPGSLEQVQLYQNYPNPFSGSTSVNYFLPNVSDVLLKIYSVNGEEVRTLVEEVQSSGVKSVLWDGSDQSGQLVSAGVYICQLQVNSRVMNKKMILIY